MHDIQVASFQQLFHDDTESYNPNGNHNNTIKFPMTIQLICSIDILRNLRYLRLNAVSFIPKDKNKDSIIAKIKIQYSARLHYHRRLQKAICTNPRKNTTDSNGDSFRFCQLMGLISITTHTGILFHIPFQ